MKKLATLLFILTAHLSAFTTFFKEDWDTLSSPTNATTCPDPCLTITNNPGTGSPSWNAKAAGPFGGNSMVYNCSVFSFSLGLLSNTASTAIDVSVSLSAATNLDQGIAIDVGSANASGNPQTGYVLEGAFSSNTMGLYYSNAGTLVSMGTSAAYTATMWLEVAHAQTNVVALFNGVTGTGSTPAEIAVFDTHRASGGHLALLGTAYLTTVNNYFKNLFAITFDKQIMTDGNSLAQGNHCSNQSGIRPEFETYMASQGYHIAFVGSSKHGTAEKWPFTDGVTGTNSATIAANQLGYMATTFSNPDSTCMVMHFFPWFNDYNQCYTADQSYTAVYAMITETASFNSNANYEQMVLNEWAPDGNNYAPFYNATYNAITKAASNGVNVWDASFLGDTITTQSIGAGSCGGSINVYSCPTGASQMADYAAVLLIAHDFATPLPRFKQRSMDLLYQLKLGL